MKEIDFKVNCVNMPHVSGVFRQILRQKAVTEIPAEKTPTENLLKGIIHSTLLHRTPNWHEHCDRLLIPGLDYFLTHFSELFPQSHSSSSFSLPCCTFFVIQPSFRHEQCRKAPWGHGDKQKNAKAAALLEKFPLGKLFRWRDRQHHVRIQLRTAHNYDKNNKTCAPWSRIKMGEKIMSLYAKATPW